MTTLRELLQQEQYDDTEPASFYVPGSQHWNEPKAKAPRRVPNQGDDDNETPLKF